MIETYIALAIFTAAFLVVALVAKPTQQKESR
jgi:hypothetical protein